MIRNAAQFFVGWFILGGGIFICRLGAAALIVWWRGPPQ